MVLGIGEGKITVTLPKSIYAPGETMRGKAVLSLNAPKKARALRLDLYREVYESSMGSKGAHKARMVEFTKQLAGNRAYANGEEYEFELLAPSGASSLQLPPSPISGVINALASLAPAPRWFVSVSLDLPMSLDISGRVQIQMQPSRQAGQTPPIQ